MQITPSNLKSPGKVSIAKLRQLVEPFTSPKGPRENNAENVIERDEVTFNPTPENRSLLMQGKVS